MSLLSISALKALSAVADQGGVIRAAEKLALSQSAVSHKIKRLEESLGCVLLNRRAGGPLLTEDGYHLLAYGRRIVSLHDEAVMMSLISAVAMIYILAAVMPARMAFMSSLMRGISA